MAGVEPYSPCPCGSGQKFKWCCHKVESFADKAQRLFDGGQAEAAIKVLDEGLRKEPGNPWLLTRKALIQIRQRRGRAGQGDAPPGPREEPEALRRPGPADPLRPGDRGAGQRGRDVPAGPRRRSRGGTVPGSPRWSGSSPRCSPRSGSTPPRSTTWSWPPARDADGSASTPASGTSASPKVSPWLKDRLRPRAGPGAPGRRGPQRVRGGRGQMAEHGLWAPAAAAFDPLSGRDPGGEADYNLGLCRLWLGDEAGAVGPLRRAVEPARRHRPRPSTSKSSASRSSRPTPRTGSSRSSSPGRSANREALLAALRAAPTSTTRGPTPIDPDEPDAPVVDEFALLDRPRLDPHDGRGLKRRPDPPDPRARSWSARSRRAGDLRRRPARRAWATASPPWPARRSPRRTRRPRSSATSPGRPWRSPGSGSSPRGSSRPRPTGSTRRSGPGSSARSGPNTPMPYLGFRTPVQAARDGDAEVPLRAALCQFEHASGRRTGPMPRSGDRLNIPPEPPIDPATVDVERLALGRLRAVPVERLDDARLVAFYRRARRAHARRASWSRPPGRSPPGRGWSSRGRSTGSRSSPTSPALAAEPGRQGRDGRAGSSAAGSPSPPPPGRSTPWSGTWSNSGSSPGSSRPRPGSPRWPSSWNATARTRRPIRSS